MSAGTMPSDDAVTLARADFDQIVNALAVAIGAKVAIQELCELSSHIMSTGLTFAFGSVAARQEEAVYDAANMLREKYGRDPFAVVPT